jgi:MraZ protein
VELISNLSPQADPPKGAFTARVDEKGRLKLPSKLQLYLNSFGTPRVFVTSLDTTTARIYPISIWKENEILLENYTEDPQAAEHIAFIANHFGEDVEVDNQGRVLLPQVLRQWLGIENQQVHLQWFKGRITISTDKVYDSQFAASMENLASKLGKVEKGGLK